MPFDLPAFESVKYPIVPNRKERLKNCCNLRNFLNKNGMKIEIKIWKSLKLKRFIPLIGLKFKGLDFKHHLKL